MLCSFLNDLVDFKSPLTVKSFSSLLCFPIVRLVETEGKQNFQIFLMKKRLDIEFIKIILASAFFAK